MSLNLQMTELELAAGTQWKDVLLDYDGSNNLIYLGKQIRAGASSSDRDWLIWKYTWTSSNLTRIHGPVEGAWDARTTLF